MPLRPRLPVSLTARMVATAVLLVATVSLLIALSTAFAVRAFLLDQLDDDLRQAAARAAGPFSPYAREGAPLLPPPAGAPDPDDERGGRDGRDADDGPFGQAAGTVSVVVRGDGTVAGDVIERSGEVAALDDEVLEQVAALDGLDDDRPSEVDLEGLGEYRLVATDVGGATVVTGLPTADVDRTLLRVLGVEGGLLLVAVVGAGLAAALLVRRELRPLREVATTAHSVAAVPLARGEVGTTARVPAGLTDERTEVGQVGSALNTMLDHVEDALRARHASEQQVRQFVADASHELRTPLATIKGYAELSRRTRTEGGAGLEQAMDKVEVEADRMSSLVEDLLLLARLDAGRPLEQAPVDLTHLVLEGVADARVLAPDHRWVLDLADEPVVVTGDEQRLHQTLVNLLGNARRHTPPGTTVTVRLRPGGEPSHPGGAEPGAELVVADDGPGVPADLLPRVFERFARGDAARTRASGSVGLGLSLVQAIVAAHGGTVSVDSHPGATAFTVRLP